MSEQRTDEWFQRRAGKFTASRASDLMTKLKSGQPSASRSNLITTLAVERLTGRCVETYQNGPMLRGIEMEAEARDAYSFEMGVPVDEIDFVDHPTLPMCGMSPDGLIGDEGLIELKCPSSATKHLEALRSGAHAAEYRWQIQHQLFVSGREWCDAVSYHPEFPDGLRLAVKRVFRNAEDHQMLAGEIARGHIEVEGIVKELKELGKVTA